MTRDLERTSTPDQDVLGQRPSFPTVGARIGNIATNVLVTGIILIVGIAFGREVISWWRHDPGSHRPSPIAAVVGTENSLTAAGHTLLEFGDFPFVLDREDVVGDLAIVLTRLRESSHRALASPQPLASQVSPAEQRMLKAANRLTPIEEQDGDWSIYQIEAPLPMVVAVQHSKSNVATVDQRVVSWGIAVPVATRAGEQQHEWTLFTYSSDSTADDTSQTSTWQTPPGGHRTLSLRTTQGGNIVSYTGITTVDTWTDFYDELFAKSSSTDQQWRVDFGTWRCRFETDDSRTVDVVMRGEGDGVVRCLVNTSQNQDAHSP